MSFVLVKDNDDVELPPQPPDITEAANKSNAETVNIRNVGKDLKKIKYIDFIKKNTSKNLNCANITPGIFTCQNTQTDYFHQSEVMITE